jgi:hypothetical protein
MHAIKGQQGKYDAGMNQFYRLYRILRQKEVPPMFQEATARTANSVSVLLVPSSA